MPLRYFTGRHAIHLHACGRQGLLAYSPDQLLFLVSYHNGAHVLSDMILIVTYSH